MKNLKQNKNLAKEEDRLDDAKRKAREKRQIKKRREMIN